VSRVQRNLIANFLGKGVVAVSGLAFIPLYMRFFSLDSFAIVALVPSFSALASILDMGITPVVNRELARLSAKAGAGAAMRDLVRSFEIMAWLMALLLGLLGAMLIPPLLGHWAGASSLSAVTLRNAAFCLALNLALQWPTGLYTGALVGMQSQIVLSIIYGVMALLRNGGVVLVLWLVSPTVEAFLLWQALISITLTLILAVLLWRGLPQAPRRPRARVAVIKKTWRLAAGMSGTSIASLLATQIDKLVLSQVLSLEMFGYYMLGTTIASKLVLINAPIVEAVFPRMTQLAHGPNQEALRALYRRSIQLAAVAFLPATVIFLFFGADIMTIWTLNPGHGQGSGRLTAALVAGFAASALMDITMVFDWARGRAKVVFWARLGGCILLVPALIGGGLWAGALGGAVAWSAVQIGILLAATPLIDRGRPSGQVGSWYLQSLLPPLLAALPFVWLCSLFDPSEASIGESLVVVAVATAAAYGAAALSSPFTRDIIYRTVRRLERRAMHTPSGGPAA
jgi:O-antigen/teichoic acid export membrane protein